MERVFEIDPALNVSPLWRLFGITLDSETEEIIRHYQALPPELRQIFRDILNAIAPKPDTLAPNHPIPAFQANAEVSQLPDPT
ncbi:hypothetical protein C7374_12811 [Falsochrobactrum ovis]|uniref:Uncharacterized protein n=1 Tax=Falsochrobactrum ovis TaxID=1293442 RepID=A0A364JRG7_9HYPH|nr:hypothetical protein C7374_12811 [Falsochrobactrum ovis]